MSLFNRGSSTPSGFSQPSASQQAQIDQISAEVEMFADVFYKLQKSCSAKCLAMRNTEPDLTKGESVCLDRCARKYMETNLVVGKAMAKLGQENQARASQGGGGLTGFGI